MNSPNYYNETHRLRFLKTTSDFRNAVSKSESDGKCLILKLYLNSCAACGNLDDLLEEMSIRFEQKCDFYQADCTGLEDVVREFRVVATPAILLIRDGRLKDRYVGSCKARLQLFFDRNFA